MELSTLIAKIISVIYISGGIAVLLGNINFNIIAQDFGKSAALTFIAGSFGIILGMILVEHHNLWVKNWTVLITVISWSLLFGGFAIVIFPKSLTYFSKHYMHSRAWGVYMICFGLLLGYFGFIH